MADLDNRGADAGQPRRLRRAEVGVVDAGDRQVLRDAHAGLAAGDHPTNREDVIGGNHRGRRMGKRQHLLHGGFGCRQRNRCVLHAFLGKLQPALCQRLAQAGAARPRAIVAGNRRAQQPDAAVTEPDQVPRDLERRGLVVEADARVAIHRVDAPGKHVRPSVVVEQREECRIMVEPDEHERIDPVLDQLAGDLHLRLQVVVLLGEHQRVAPATQALLQSAGGARIERIVERGDHRTDHLAAMAAQ
jgi:hypothetical protein